MGNRLHDAGTQRVYTNEQYSGELQLNYNDDLMNVTAGAIYFQSSENEGGPSTMFSSKTMYVAMPNNTGLVPQANGTVGTQSPARSAVRAQGEIGRRLWSGGSAHPAGRRSGRRSPLYQRSQDRHDADRGQMESGHPRRPGQWLHELHHDRGRSRGAELCLR